MAAIIDMVCSAVVIVLPPGVFMTTMPRRVAASVSTLSKPVPARPTIRRRPPASITSFVTLVIVRDDLIGDVLPITPSVYDYAKQAEADSMLNTPPTYGIYLAGLVFKWLKAQGGLAAMATVNERKANKLYAAIDGSSFYSNPVEKASRSWMNVPFILAKAELDKDFLAGATAAGLTTLEGHRSVGGMRASVYNAMPEAGVDALIAYMADFEKRKA